MCKIMSMLYLKIDLFKLLFYKNIFRFYFIKISFIKNISFFSLV